MNGKAAPILRSAGLALFLCASAAGSLLLGAQPLRIREALCDPQSFSRLILTQIRLPRTLLAGITGAMLAGSGAAFQLFFRNPLAEPGILGVSAGATLGAVIASCLSAAPVLGGAISPVNAGAFAGALAAGLLVMLLAGRHGGPAATVALLLCGSALGVLYSALIAIILALHDAQLHTMYIWMLGSLSGRGWHEALFIAPAALLATVLLVRCARQLDLLAGGEMTALALGVAVPRLRLRVLLAGALASSAAVCAGGTIGFVGLVAPHAIRGLFGARGRTLIPRSMAAGAALMLCADTISRTAIPPSEIPVGTVTALIGAPFFISLLYSRFGLRNG